MRGIAGGSCGSPRRGDDLALVGVGVDVADDGHMRAVRPDGVESFGAVAGGRERGGLLRLRVRSGGGLLRLRVRSGGGLLRLFRGVVADFLGWFLRGDVELLVSH